MKIIKFLNSSTLYNSQSDILLFWVSAWVMRLLIVPKQTLITLLHNQTKLCKFCMCISDN